MKDVTILKVFLCTSARQVELGDIKESKFEKCSHVIETLLGVWKGKRWRVRSELAKGQ